MFTFQKDPTAHLHTDKASDWSFQESRRARSLIRNVPKTGAAWLWPGGGDEQSADRSPDKTAPANGLLVSPAFTSLCSAAPEFLLWFSIFLHFYIVTCQSLPSKTCQMLSPTCSQAEASGHINNSSGWDFRRCQTSHGPGPPPTETTRRQTRPFKAILATLPSSVSSVLFLLFPVLFMLLS